MGYNRENYARIRESYENKYKDDTAEYYIPARLDAKTAETVRENAVAVYRSLDCKGFSRVDFFVTADGEVLFNEINTIPGSLSFYLWEYSGINFTALIDRLIEIAFRRKQDAGFKAVNYGENIFAAKSTGGAKTGGKLGGSKFGAKM